MLSKKGKKTEKENQTFHNIDDANIWTKLTFISSKTEIIYICEKENNNNNNDDRKKKMLMTTNIYNRKKVLVFFI